MGEWGPVFDKRRSRSNFRPTAVLLVHLLLLLLLILLVPTDPASTTTTTATATDRCINASVCDSCSYIDIHDAYMYTDRRMHIPTYLLTYLHTYICTHTNIYIYIYTHTCIHTYMNFTHTDLHA